VPEPIEVDDVEIDLPGEPEEEERSPRRPGIVDRVRRRIARRLRRAANRIRR